ncbi:hypothetical protein [Maridesulfovibrio bastinii]|uniref:hypothetical protein n=1 Tax=Maridesulfovibrio bastinii TaxID=47157 RepID=UPI0003F69891|nr:hypothetical protein [Maridesulfovibrio bastinii]
MKIRFEQLIERYCDECENFDSACGGGENGECDAIWELLIENGCPRTCTVKASDAADKCKFFDPIDPEAYAEKIREQEMPLWKINGVRPGYDFPATLREAS